MQQLWSKICQSSLIRFGVVGLISTLIDIFVLNLANHFGASTWISTGIGFIAGATNGYFLNSKFVFAKDKSYARYTKYLIISLGGLLLTELIVTTLHDLYSLNLNLGKLVAVMIVFFWNYLGSKIWAFK